MTYELYLTTVHCIGRLNHVVGVVDTDEEARAWVEGKAVGSPKPARIPKDDPIVWCPVKHCHMKRQKIIRSYHEIRQEDVLPINNDADAKQPGIIPKV